MNEHERENERKVKMILGDQAVPADMLIYDDPVYGNRMYVRKGTEYVEQTKTPKEPVWVHNLRKYVMSNSASFVAAVSQFGNSDDGVIFYGPERVVMFFNEANREESIGLPLALSMEMRAFLGDGPGVAGSQKSFLTALETYPECITDAVTIRAMVERLQMSKEIKFESNLDPDNITFLYSERGGQQECKLPKKLTLVLPYFEGSGNKVTIEAVLDVGMPQAESEKPSFKLENPKYARTEREALQLEIKSLQAALPGWLFLNGK